MAPPAFGSRTRDRKRLVYAEMAIFLFTISRPAQSGQITKTSDAETNPQFTLDEKRVAFMRGGNLYAMSLDTGMIEQMTDIHAAAAAGAPTAAPAGVEEEDAAVAEDAAEERLRPRTRRERTARNF